MAEINSSKPLKTQIIMLLYKRIIPTELAQDAMIIMVLIIGILAIITILQVIFHDEN